jgi:hypothetical protein
MLSADSRRKDRREGKVAERMVVESRDLGEEAFIGVITVEKQEAWVHVMLCNCVEIG